MSAQLDLFWYDRWNRPIPSSSFRCLDCDADVSDLGEYFMVRDELWTLATREARGERREMLCVGCLEERLGRRLSPEDFSNVPLNRERGWKSARLLERLEGPS